MRALKLCGRGHEGGSSYTLMPLSLPDQRQTLVWPEHNCQTRLVQFLRVRFRYFLFIAVIISNYRPMLWLFSDLAVVGRSLTALQSARSPRQGLLRH